MRIEEKTAQKLLQKKKTLSIAESCTGGLLSHRLTNIPGSSQFFKFGLIPYANEAKIKSLAVSPLFIKTHGAVSPQVAMAMAEKVRKILNSDIGMSITGIAGPSGATKTKPIGLTYIALNSNLESICLECVFKGSRSQIKTLATNEALKLLHDFIS